MLESCLDSAAATFGSKLKELLSLGRMVVMRLGSESQLYTEEVAIELAGHTPAPSKALVHVVNIRTCSGWILYFTLL